MSIMSSARSSPRRRAPTLSPQERRDAILSAARDTFIDKGFAAARIEDVAACAGIAKGTVYLHFDSKEALFKALIESIADAPMNRMQALLRDDVLSSAELLRRIVGTVRDEILKTERRHVLRLLLTEGHRFPEIAELHYERVVRRAMQLLRRIVARGIARGEFGRDALERFPQLFAAPLLLAVIWEGLFGARDPLDVDGLLDAHLDLLLHGLGTRR
jgi:AcrR family transcriptional regulator